MLPFDISLKFQVNAKNGNYEFLENLLKKKYDGMYYIDSVDPKNDN